MTLLSNKYIALIVYFFKVTFVSVISQADEKLIILFVLYHLTAPLCLLSLSEFAAFFFN